MKIRIELINPPGKAKQWNAGIVGWPGSQFQNLADPECLEFPGGSCTLTVLMWVWSPGSSFPSQEIEGWTPEDRAIYTYNWKDNTISRTGTMEPEVEEEEEEKPEIPEGQEKCSKCDGAGVVECPKCVCQTCGGEGEVECKRCDGRGHRRIRRRRRVKRERG